MLTRLLPPQLSFHISLRFTASFPPHLLLKPSHFSTISATSSDNYGPSLHKGFRPTTPPPPPTTTLLLTQNETELFDDNIFTRIYDIAALRVPAEHCASLERRLRGHLLNWPRVRNIGRLPGDEIQPEFQIEKIKEEDVLVSLNRRIYGKAEGDGERLSGVLYRDKLVKNFNSKGYLNFRNLAKLSRPRKRTKGEGEGGNGDGTRGRGVGKNEMVMLKVVEDEGNEDEGLGGLLGEEFKGGKWKGSTRLLLLDERYADKMIDEMPEAIKVNNS